MPGNIVRIRGIVQGVGFRPMIWRLAQQHQLTGKVWNDGQGVLIHVQGQSTDLQEFLRQIPLQLPPLAKLTALEVTELNDTQAYQSFQIVTSQADCINTPIAADAATCPACLADITEPGNRRFGYAFTNCTHCGPRLSIVRQVPYDRDNTSMAEFPLCRQCQQEYDDPSDRRFHAQATCCPACGPQLWLEDHQGQGLACENPIRQAAALLKQGYIVAVKGLGGFHLACAADNAEAVRRLRERKRRYAKPCALMARDVQVIACYAQLQPEEQRALQDKAAPIVLLTAQGQSLPEAIAPNDDKLGFMLPYTPLHTLLLQDFDSPIVLTSGNLSDEPQCTANEQARAKLAGIADYLLLHERSIVNRLDDSVLRLMDGKLRVLRRARGFSPEALLLPIGFESARPILAMGAELKNSFCLLKNGQAVVAQHIGDLENVAVQYDYRNAIALYQQLYDFQPECLAVDSHAGYLSSQYGQVLAETAQLAVVTVQHH
ncbi:MAG: carbamoyltransferase HypF, partial [Methylococcales bacterium]